MKSVSHIAGVVKIIDYLEKTDSCVIVMQRPAKSKDLFDYITKKGHLQEWRARRFFRQIVQATEACHKAGVLHRDLKDENILVDLDSEILHIIDFGSGTPLTDDGEYTEFDG